VQERITIITSKAPPIGAYISEIYQYRYLIYALTVRDIKLRYTQTKLGWLWAFVQPLLTMAVFTFFFAYIIKLDTGNIPYPLVALSGMLIWNYFGNVANAASMSLIASQELIKKIRFPKICLIISKTLVALLDLFVSLFILIVAVYLSDIKLTIHLTLLPILLLLNIITSFTFALWFSALTIKNRDLLNLIPHIITLGTWLTPVFYVSTLIPQELSFLSYLNPIAAIIDGVRFCLLGTRPPHIGHLAGVLMILLLFIVGVFHFKNTEKVIADYI
jgi:lipopolysaccharide transport system permease protein